MEIYRELDRLAHLDVTRRGAQYPVVDTGHMCKILPAVALWDFGIDTEWLKNNGQLDHGNQIEDDGWGTFGNPSDFDTWKTQTNLFAAMLNTDDHPLSH